MSAWFKPKRFGWGARPASWQGWLVCAAVSAAAIGIGLIAEHRGEVWGLLLLPLLAGFGVVVLRTLDRS